MTKFQPIDFYRSTNDRYSLLPFRFTELNADSYVVSNLVGEYQVVNKSSVHDLINHRLDPDDPTYIEMRARHFLIDDNSSIAPELLAIKLRTKHQRLSEFTGLHIFVVSLRCEHSCPYCQVSRQSENKQQFDMTREMAIKAIDLTFRSPAKNIKIEFQGGKPLLNFDLIKYIVLEAKQRNRSKKESGFRYRHQSRAS